MGLGALAGVGGDMGGGGSPEELLAQIRDLLDQYLALGPDTPVAPEAQQFADAIDAATGGGADQGAMPPDAETPQDAAMSGPEETQEAGPPMPPGGPKDFGSASDMALADLKKKKAKAY